MKQIVPDYYGEFSCIADRCRHSCCIGWEIDIDEDTLERYRRVEGEFGLRLAAGIVWDGETASFRLDDHDRCPFLNECGLCDIILNIGEDALSQICTDHPRFRNFFSDREEVGLGLCCEAAGSLILGRNDKMALTEHEDDEPADALSDFERHILEVRAALFELAQNRSMGLDDRFARIQEYVGETLPERAASEWAGFYRTLERLDPAWDEKLDCLKSFSGMETLFGRFETAFEQLLVYFLYRHVAAAQDEWDIAARALFSVHATKFIAAMCAANLPDGRDCTLEDIVEISRMYSSEIEYSDENIQAILDELME